MVTPDVVTPDATALVATAVAQAFGLFAAMLIAADVSGGHVNPAVTFAFAIGGHIGVPSAIFYWASQLLGSTFACLVLHYLSAGQARRNRLPRSLPPRHICRNPSSCFYSFQYSNAPGAVTR
jgi:aquaporin TIP